MKVTLADPVVEIDGWLPEMEQLGQYTLKVRKTPEEMREERELKRQRYGAGAFKVVNFRSLQRTCISHQDGREDVAYFLPGLWPRVKAWLEQRNVQYELVDRRNPEIRPPLDMSALDGFEFRAQQDVAIALVATSDCGIIETNTGWGKSAIVSLLCRLYPTLRIVVTTKSTSVVATLYEYLCKMVPGEVGVMGGGRDTAAGKRVVVTTLKSLPNIRPDWAQLVLVDECHDVGDNEAGHALMQFCWARRFGFSASPVRNDGSGRMLESILGPTILKMEYQEAVDAGMVVPMKYVMLPCAGCPPIAKNPGLPEVMLKRMSYWINRSRNNAIRQFVYALKQVYGGQILIMCSTLEACIQLNSMLPWFKVAYYGSSDLDDMAAKFPKEKYPNVDLKKYKMTAKQLDIMRAAFGKGTLRYVISTKVFKQGCNFPHLRCLIRADGDVSSIEGIQIPGRLARLDEGKDCAYLVDIDDQFSPWAHNRSQARERLYDQMKWQKVGIEEVLDGLRDRTEGDGGEPAVEPG